ncbi:MAG: GNAT family N-acetyltransferase [Arcobacter sp.]|nr:MAG: GNAT family N-acetyltransferase [Arcobacter sp.]
MSLPELQNEDITLRELSLDDAQGVYPSWLNDPVVTKFNSHGEKEYTKEMAIEYISSVKNSKTHHVFSIIYHEQHIGNISLQNIDWTNRCAEFAIIIGNASVYGKGIGHTAGKLLIDYGFNVLNLHRIYCGTSQDNIGMQHLAIKLGMKKEGQRIDAFLKNHTYKDVLDYGIVQEK